MPNYAIHLRTGNLVAWPGCSPVLAPFRQGISPWQIRIVDDNPQYPGGTGQPYITADLTDYPQLRVGLWSASAFAEGTGEDANLALASSSALAPVFSYNTTDSADKYFEGDWNLATAAIAALSGKRADVIFTVVLVKTSDVDYLTLIDLPDGASSNARLLAATDDGFAATPGATTDGTARLRLPVNFYDPGTGREWQWAYDATTDGPKLTEL